MNPGRCLLVGIAGGTCAGKTTIANELRSRLGEDNAVIIPQDAYYKDRSHLPLEERHKLNYDHPDAFENDLLIRHLQKLKNFEPIERPVYDFVTHTRKKETILVEPKPIVIVEGITILVSEGIRDLLDFKIFVEADADVRVIRRVERDLKERGRTFDSVKRQYLETVRPMHLTFVEPSKRYADIIIPQGGHNEIALDILLGRLRSHIE